ncbi:MAG: hypothetical protein Q7R62_03180 [bacterium]|nr:hypothetical protein [bacterium]
MYNFIVEMSMLVSLGLIVYLFARAVPRIAHDHPEDVQPLSGFDRFVNKLPLEKLDKFLHSFFEKTLRKIRIVLMKIDNYLNSHLKNLKEKQEAAKSGDEMKKKIELMTVDSNIPNVTLPTQENQEEPKA